MRRFVTFNKQTGIVVILLMLVLVLGVSSYLLSGLDFSQVQQQRDDITQRALASVKDEVIAKMVINVDGAAPDVLGQLHCPDTNNTGQTNDAGNDCVANNNQGRIPFLTLDIKQPLDQAQETLWYASSQLMDTAQINSNTLVNGLAAPNNLLTIDGENALAVIIAPGLPLNATQVAGRNTAPTDITNYLEDDNADGDSSFTRGVSINNFNDNLISIDANDVLDVVHQGLVNSIRNYLENFYSVNGFYPYPEKDDYECDNNTPENLGINITIGRLPLVFNYATGLECVYPTDAPANNDGMGIDDLDGSLLITSISSANSFRDEIWYAVSPFCQMGNPCDNSGTDPDYITLDGNRMKYVFIIAGENPSPIAAGNFCDGIPYTQSNPAVVTNFCDYLEDYTTANENTDADLNYFSNTSDVVNNTRNDVIYGEAL